MRGFTTLVADRDGVVSAINAEAGQVVAAGQSIVTVAADGEREVSISIPESRVDELRKAQKLTIAVWAHPEKSWSGKLRELAPDADSVTRTYSARISILDADADPSLLRLGMTASVMVPDVDGSGAVRVPLTAVVDHERSRQVWVVDPKTSRVVARSEAWRCAERQRHRGGGSGGRRDGGDRRRAHAAARPAGEGGGGGGRRPGGRFEVKGVNLSEWALKHPQMIAFLLLLLSVAGVLAYGSLGQKEDPEFTIKTMVVQAYWPGSSAQQMADQVADKLERKLQEVAEIDYTSTYVRPGETQIKVNLREEVPRSAVPDVWYQVRKKMGDIRHTLPQGTQGPSSMTSSGTRSATSTPSPATDSTMTT
jgi:hypothetical protein